MTIEPLHSLKSVNLSEPVQFSAIEGISHCVKLPSHVAQRQASSAKEKLVSRGLGSVNITIETYPPDKDPHFAPGSGITLFTKSSAGSIIGADSIGERGKPAERVGEEAAMKLLSEIESKAPLDRHMGDILIPYMAVAEGRSEILVSQVTMHTLTNIKVAEIITGVEFDVEGEVQKPGRVGVQGIALRT